MKRATIGVAFLGAAMAVQGAAFAQDKVDLGKHEYDSRCAVCHGAKGKGDGPFVGLGSLKAADLTTLAKRNGGVFPFQRVYEIIDGRQALRAHGTREMPIWGTDYRVESGGENYRDLPYDPEAYVRTRILALTEYVYRLQEK